MRDYAKISPFFWTKGSGKKLRGDAMAQVVAVYISSAPAANMVGIYYVALATIANDTGHTIEVVSEALKRIAIAGYAFYDFEAELVWIPNHARFEIGPEMTPGDKRRKKVLAELAQVDGHRFASEFRSLYGAAYRLGTPSCPPLGPAAPETKPLPDSDPTPDGASDDREQDRSGQDRSDQIRTGQIDSASAGGLTSPATKPGAVRERRGSRLPAGWTPSAETQAWARQQGVHDPCGRTLDEFRDFWTGVSGARGVKLDWEATYRNRIRQVVDRQSGHQRVGPRSERQPHSTDWLERMKQTGTGGDL